MIYDIRQATTYHYASPVAYARHVLRLTPIDRLRGDSRKDNDDELDRFLAEGARDQSELSRGRRAPRSSERLLFVGWRSLCRRGR